MRCSELTSALSASPATVTLLLAAVLVGWLSAPSAVEKSLTVYAARSTFSVPLTERDSNTYVDLQSVLEKLGPVSASIEGNRLKLHCQGNDAQFTDGARDARVGRSRVSMAAPFHLENGRPQVSLRSLSDLLGRLLGTRVDYREASQRLFVGVSPVHFVAELKRGQPSALVLSFSAPVSPQISAEGARLQMTFSRDPLAGGAQTWKFDDPLINSAAYAEDSAPPEISVTGSEPLLASFSDGGRTITISAAPKASAGTAPITPSAPAPAPAATTASPQTAPSNTPPSQALPQPGANVGSPSPAPLAEQLTAVREHFLLLLDAGHGGEERGATLSESILEKDVNLAIARRLRAELQNRGVTVSMLRDGDQTISLDRRAETANALRPALYLALHAASMGRGVRIYTSTLPSAPSSRSTSFVPWATAQSGYVSATGNIATALLDELGKNPFRISVGLMPAPVRPLNNIAGAAVAVEVSPQRDDVASLSDPDYQQSVAVALATAIATLRPQLEGGEPSR